METLGPEIRLFILLATLAIVVSGAISMARRLSADGLQVAVDSLLIVHVVQYLAVGAAGSLGLLSAWSVILTSIVLGCALLCFSIRISGPPSEPPTDQWDRWILLGCAAVFIGMVTAAVWNQSVLPPMGDDVLTYHLPAAVQWLQTGRLGLFETWTFNPANTYSPLLASALAAWWMAPLDGDMLARFIQVPAAMLVFSAVARLARQLGAPLVVAALLALATGTARPFMSQVIMAKDDLLLTAFFLATLTAFTSSDLQTERSRRVQALRLGVAMGLFLATKYTALYSMPLLLLAIDGSIRGKWRAKHVAIAVGLVLILAGPWYLRNLIVTGNPLFPMDLPGLAGILHTRRAPELGSWDGARQVLSGGHYGLPLAVIAVLLVAWTLAWTNAKRLGEPLVRLVLIGPIVGFTIFYATAPYGELRFAYPSLALLFLSPALIVSWRLPAAIATAAALAIASVATAFVSQRLAHLGPSILAFAVIAGALIALVYAARNNWRALLGLGAAAVSVLAAAIYVEWSAAAGSYLRGSAQTLSGTEEAWHALYPGVGEAWTYLRRTASDGQSIAYANTYFTYPLQGAGGKLRVIYIPHRKDVHVIRDLPVLSAGQRLAGVEIPLAMIEAQSSGADEQVWLANLRDSKAELLFIAKTDPTGSGVAKPPPELDWARKRFERIFENNAAVIYRLAGR